MSRPPAPSFAAERARGRAYEVAVTRWLQAARGYTTLPVFDCVGPGRGWAPLVAGPQSDGQVVRLIAPDILACKAGTWTWFEVKLKEYAPRHRISGTRVTGLPSATGRLTTPCARSPAVGCGCSSSSS